MTRYLEEILVLSYLALSPLSLILSSVTLNEGTKAQNGLQSPNEIGSNETLHA